VQRSTRSFALTEEGRALHARVTPALEALRDAETVVRAMRERPSGTLRVAAPPLFAELFLPPVLATYGRRFPEVQVELLLENRVVDLVDEGIDCALRAGRLGASSLVARALGRGRMRVYGSPEYLRARGEPEHPAGLRDHDVVLFTGRREGPRWSFSARGSKVTVTVKPRVRVNSMTAVRELACASMGLCLLPSFVVRDAVQRGELREVLNGWSGPRGTMSVVYPGGRHLAPRTRTFVDALVEHFTAHPLVD
jgi:DNA-binding transcriptional LysR family regulator